MQQSQLAHRKCFLEVVPRHQKPKPQQDIFRSSAIQRTDRQLNKSPSDTYLGADTRDVYLNDVACWQNVPARVWAYTIGGYQVMKKWLSYREHELLGRDLTAAEVREGTQMARRIAALCLLASALDANYAAVKAAAYAWPATI